MYVARQSGRTPGDPIVPGLPPVSLPLPPGLPSSTSSSSSSWGPSCGIFHRPEFLWRRRRRRCTRGSIVENGWDAAASSRQYCLIAPPDGAGRAVNGTASLSRQSHKPSQPVRPPARRLTSRPNTALKSTLGPGGPTAAPRRAPGPRDGAARRKEISETEGLICDWS